MRGIRNLETAYVQTVINRSPSVLCSHVAIPFLRSSFGGRVVDSICDLAALRVANTADERRVRKAPKENSSVVSWRAAYLRIRVTLHLTGCTSKLFPWCPRLMGLSRWQSAERRSDLTASQERSLLLARTLDHCAFSGSVPRSGLR